VAERSPRKLAVILHADVVGSTALVQRDESLAHERIRDAFQRFSATIESYGGHPLELRGDALVAEFNRASDAVEASLAFQADNSQFNSTLGDDVQPTLRVGISLGEVVVADNTITGEGIVLAQRLEQLASAGGVCIQGAVYEAVPGRLPFAYESLGEQELKGFSEPVRAYAVTLKAGEVIPAAESIDGRIWATLEVPDKPSIAVLPFTNISGDSEQEYFSDGITDDLITDLSKVSGLFVIARNSSFVFKGKATNVTQVGKALGVRYVLEGSVRRAGGTLRINAQLIEAASGNHLWAERYDGDLTDIFALQDQITENVVAALAVTLTRAEQSRALGKETKDLQAYDYVLRGNSYHHRMTKEDNHKAKEMFERAIERDPEYAPAYAGLAWVLVHDSNQGWSSDAQRTLKAGLENAERAVVLDDSLAKAHLVLGDAYCWTKRYEQAVAEGRRAVALDPSYADGHMALAYYLVTAGYAEEGVEEARKALRFNPVHANRIYYGVLSACHYMLKQYEAAIEAGEQALSRDPEHYVPHMLLAAAFAQLEKIDEARRHAQEIMRLNPSFSLRHYAESLPFKNKTDLDPSNPSGKSCSADIHNFLFGWRFWVDPGHSRLGGPFTLLDRPGSAITSRSMRSHLGDLNDSSWRVSRRSL
jgi:adenylate cyclase